MFADSKIKSLVVEDSIVASHMMQSMLNRYGDCETAANGWIALEKCVTRKYDIIFVDLYMPEMNGFDFIATFRKTDKETPIVITTAVTDMEELCKSFYGDENIMFLAKPVTSKNIQEVVCKIFCDHKKEAIA